MRPNTVTLIANWIPLEAPNGGPNFYKFGDDVLYRINVDNNGDANDDIVYEFRFTTRIQNDKTFLYNTGPITSLDDPDFNIGSSTRSRVTTGTGRHVLARDLATPPVNVGPRSTPNYDALAAAAVYSLPDGTQGVRRPARRSVLRRSGIGVRPARPASVQSGACHSAAGHAGR